MKRKRSFRPGLVGELADGRDGAGWGDVKAFRTVPIALAMNPDTRVRKGALVEPGSFLSWKRLAWTGSLAIVGPSRDTADWTAVVTVWTADLTAVARVVKNEGGLVVVETGLAFQGRY